MYGTQDFLDYNYPLLYYNLCEGDLLSVMMNKKASLAIALNFLITLNNIIMNYISEHYIYSLEVCDDRFFWSTSSILGQGICTHFALHYFVNIAIIQSYFALMCENFIWNYTSLVL